MAIPLARYRLSRAALDQRRFLATELAAATGVPLNTVYAFIRDLGSGVTSEPLASGGVGRPQKLYTLTDAGVAYLLDRNLEVVNALRLGREALPITEATRGIVPGRTDARRAQTAAQLHYAEGQG